MSLAEAAPITRDDRFVNTESVDDQRLGDSTPRTSDFNNEADQREDTKKDGKSKMRSLFGLGKKKPSVLTKSDSKPDTNNSKPESQPESRSESQTPSNANSNPASPPLSRDASKLSSKQPSWPPTGEQSFALPSSPGRGFTGSPRLSSPATSQIFERDVQDSTVLKPNSPAIPTHIQTENYIPPVLDDASEAITNEKLDPDTVEIVTHSSHQPAAVTVTGASNVLPSYDLGASEWAAELASFADREAVSADNASNYGSLDSSDVRRLSFISFADVVQAEHNPLSGVASSRDSIHLAGLTSLPAAVNRSPSPIRSPVSSQGPETSPPTSNPGSMKGIELSPTRRPLGSPTSTNNLKLNPSGGDLNIETMSQALRRTGSSDLSHVRSGPASPIEATHLR
ncbi:hypothetical protein IWW34DRAFT_284876 [Fusarium oxysporum f. sp. albedinis]|jgi:hypothetical protein|uniref:Uncharacterized protein n=6 Tax=Fusarium oxysporum TaxID=5507 RepID=W9ICL9_FUSOX|nr:hypothetical protein FOXG_05046 [Fusarium oxysporum f. sp. lycopersici 4287]XP_031039179.1 uncharacterized protein FOBCDRAFT_33704 [Fusarium oxysporum Fo47]EWY90261.1 hypothetical protein FOYG_07840 [Fusarium oxysporum NRRL 32931]EWZ90479.1 hypothetical protein FOWG_08114 [Fusarium oxysporum f. sp. lycopersici MN25]EXK38900.1 hypothetical protein FOMG_06402 [Fusarium oxysporum f. sp. melonis 26406]EXL56321.1 hypothetical protein FOCG_03975 [Fusarium oxysporum f. sp. radicis-lycopersici 2638